MVICWKGKNHWYKYFTLIFFVFGHSHFIKCCNIFAIKIHLPLILVYIDLSSYNNPPVTHNTQPNCELGKSFHQVEVHNLKLQTQLFIHTTYKMLINYRWLLNNLKEVYNYGKWSLFHHSLPMNRSTEGDIINLKLAS